METNPTQAQLGIRKTANNALESATKALGGLQEMEKFIAQTLISSINTGFRDHEQKFGLLSGRTDSLSECMDAVVAILGEDKVRETIIQQRKDRSSKEAELHRATIATQLEKGLIAKADKVSEKSLLVGVEYDAEGNATHPGRVWALFAELKPESQTLLLGAAVGAEAPLPVGKFVLTEIYEEVASPAADAVQN